MEIDSAGFQEKNTDSLWNCFTYSHITYMHFRRNVL